MRNRGAAAPEGRNTMRENKERPAGSLSDTDQATTRSQPETGEKP